MIKSPRRKFKISKSRLRILIGLVLTTFLILFWLDVTNPLLFESPSWLFNKPSDEIILEFLPSKKNIDYRPLKSLLQTQQWEKADRETQEKVAYLIGSFLYDPSLPPDLITPFLPEATDISKIPCTDLLTIDRLWTKFSEGRFGFSVQKKIVENDNKLPSPEEIKDRCMQQCNPQNAPRSRGGIINPEYIRCERGCNGLRFDARVKRIPEAMGRGRSKVVNPLPAGYYPSPIAVRNLDVDAYYHLAKRADRCHV